MSSSSLVSRDSEASNDTARESDGEQWRLGALKRFIVTTEKQVRARDMDNRILITKLSHLSADPLAVCAWGGADRVRARGTARNWTRFFLQNNIELTSGFTCANNFRNLRQNKTATRVEADCMFLYYHDKTKSYRGYEKGTIANSSIEQISRTNELICIARYIAKRDPLRNRILETRYRGVAFLRFTAPSPPSPCRCTKLQRAQY